MGKFSAFKLPLKSLPAGSHDFDYRLDKEFFLNMESSDIRDGSIDVHATVNNKGQYFDLNFEIKGEVTLLCDRCLDEMQWPIDTVYHIAVKYGQNFNDDSDDLLVIPESDSYLNVAYMIYDTIALNIPIKHVHPLGKCNRAMSSLLRKHRATAIGDDEMQDDIIDDEIFDGYDTVDDSAATFQEPADPRWNELKKLTVNI